MREPAPIVILTNTRDLAADDVIRRLAKSHNVLRINADKEIPGPLWNLHGRNGSIGAVWWRQFERWPQGTLDAAAIDDILVNRAQWRTWLSTLDDGQAPWINPIWNARRAENKVEQLRQAVSSGFSVPETIITNQLEQARKFSESSPSVLKSITSAYFEFSGDGFVYTHSVEDALTLTARDWREQPLIVQRRTFGDDVRIIVFDDQAFGATCSSVGIDWRKSSEKVEWSEWQVPHELSEKCRTYMSVFGLRYAAFDFIVDEDNQWFLEANQAGEWVFLDRPLKLGIAEGLAQFLARLSEGRPK